jgi:hypothetical protein
MKSTPLNEVIQKFVLFSLVGFSTFPAFSQQFFGPISNPISGAAVVVPPSLSATMQTPIAPKLVITGQSDFQTNSISPLGFAYEVGRIDTRIDYLDELIDILEGDYEEYSNTASNVGVDLGLVWVSNNLVAGVAFSDVNEPEYEHGSLASTTYTCRHLTGISLENCLVVQDANAQGLISHNEHVANAQATLLASTWFGDDVTWGFHTSIDLNDKNDAIGDIYQLANAGASVQFNNHLVPELRVGYTKNLAGTELSYYSVGITFFKKAVLDVGWSDEIVANDESNAARSAYFSFAIQTKF